MFFFPPSDVFPPVFTSEFLQMSAIDFFYFRISCHGVLVDDLGMYMYPPHQPPLSLLTFPVLLLLLLLLFSSPLLYVISDFEHYKLCCVELQKC